MLCNLQISEESLLGGGGGAVLAFHAQSIGCQYWLFISYNFQYLILHFSEPYILLFTTIQECTIPF